MIFSTFSGSIFRCWFKKTRCASDKGGDMILVAQLGPVGRPWYGWTSHLLVNWMFASLPRVLSSKNAINTRVVRRFISMRCLQQCKSTSVPFHWSWIWKLHKLLSHEAATYPEYLSVSGSLPARRYHPHRRHWTCPAARGWTWGHRPWPLSDTVDSYPKLTNHLQSGLLWSLYSYAWSEMGPCTTTH